MALTSLFHQKNENYGYHHLPRKVMQAAIFPYSRTVLNGLSDGGEPDTSIIWTVFGKDQFHLLLFSSLWDSVILLLYSSHLHYWLLLNKAPSWTSPVPPTQNCLWCVFVPSLSLKVSKIQNKRIGESWYLLTPPPFPMGLMIQIHPT